MARRYKRRYPRRRYYKKRPFKRKFHKKKFHGIRPGEMSFWNYIKTKLSYTTKAFIGAILIAFGLLTLMFSAIWGIIFLAIGGFFFAWALYQKGKFLYEREQGRKQVSVFKGRFE